MTTLHLIPKDISDLYEVHEWRNATGILTTAHPQEWQDIQEALRAFKLYRSELVTGGGNKSKIAKRLDEVLIGQRGWKETQFDTSIKVDQQEIESPTHKIDCYKNRVALEVEWNNKDPFYDRCGRKPCSGFPINIANVSIIAPGFRAPGKTKL